MSRQVFTDAARWARPKISMHRFLSREYASLPVRRPRRFWDFHVPKNAWDYRSRNTLFPGHTIAREHERDLAMRDWVRIPDERLPSPWTCDWFRWRYWTNPQPLEAVLSTRYSLDNEPLHPIMFADSSDHVHTTVFACAKTRRFYLYSGPLFGEEEMLYAFVGVFSSVEAFIEEADWNQMEQIKPAGGIVDTRPAFPLRSVTYAKIPLTSARGFRLAAEERFSKRTLWDMCPPAATFRHRPRQHRNPFKSGLDERIHEWPYIPDTQLPEPWSCDWSRFEESIEDWYDVDQDFVWKEYGRELVGFVPALYVPMSPARGDTVICPPGGAGTYYVWYNEGRIQDGPWRGEMQRFDGVYASLKHFVQTADWNRLESVAYRPTVSDD
ncbi:hypothetical protein MVEN_02517300 [Mycena venus]|uniref:Uncharacterized protein n=1 Tax=Mycena venus TaxID=2733690 RepID=A0A8H6WUK2_9AGAR|nr:hypothetical protein MVEN_02517300 [Mycena venus]